jgi:hypothetical protein
MMTAGRLSRAASAIWQRRTAEPDPMGDPSGDCGPLIAAWERSAELLLIAAAGYVTPGEYNADLRARLTAKAAGPLEISDVCQCGTALTVTTRPTRQYGGGTDTFVSCPACGHADAYV